MNGWDLSPAALADLDAALAYLAERSPRAARRLLAELEACFERIAAFPDSAPVTELPGGTVRRAVSGDYFIVYDPAARPVVILRVLHGRRDVGALLGDGP